MPHWSERQVSMDSKTAHNVEELGYDKIERSQ